MFSPIQPYLVLPFFLHVRDISLLWSFSKIILLPCHQLFYLILLDSISFGGLQLPNCILCIAICALGISPCQKWWQTILEIKGKKIDMLIQIVLHALLRGPFFPSQGGLSCSQYVFIVFSWGSSLSQVVVQDITNSTLDLSHMLCPKFNSHVYKVKSWVIGDHIGEYPLFPTKSVMGQCMWPFPFKKQCEHTHEQNYTWVRL